MNGEGDESGKPKRKIQLAKIDPEKVRKSLEGQGLYRPEPEVFQGRTAAAIRQRKNWQEGRGIAEETFKKAGDRPAEDMPPQVKKQ